VFFRAKRMSVRWAFSKVMSRAAEKFPVGWRKDRPVLLEEGCGSHDRSKERLVFELLNGVRNRDGER
jgi:hypothetical protein